MDKPRPDSASRVAAGLFNVITGRIAAKTWKAEELLEALHLLLDRPAFRHLIRHLHPAIIYRPFLNVEEANDWAGKSGKEDFLPIVRYRSAPIMPDSIPNPLGGIEILPCGWMHTGPFLDELIEILSHKFMFRWLARHIDYLQVNPGTATLSTPEGDQQFDHIVFAEGIHVKDNPWFNYLPVIPLKGQILELEIPGFQPYMILSRKVFLIPLPGDHRFAAGSTYERTFEVDTPTEEGIQQLREQVEELIRIPYKVISARAGIRPTTPDRRPMLGCHPDFPKLWVINGMGTKGVLQAPWCAAHLCDAIEGYALNKEVDIKRFER